MSSKKIATRIESCCNEIRLKCDNITENWIGEYEWNYKIAKKIARKHKINYSLIESILFRNKRHHKSSNSTYLKSKNQNRYQLFCMQINKWCMISEGTWSITPKTTGGKYVYVLVGNKNQLELANDKFPQHNFVIK